MVVRKPKHTFSLNKNPKIKEHIHQSSTHSHTGHNDLDMIVFCWAKKVPRKKVIEQNNVFESLLAKDSESVKEKLVR